MMHGRTLGFPSAASPEHMKNFVRLVKFALPYKVRFGLSVACAAMVAVLFFAELGTVYPLLHILFNSQNPQRWVSEKIVDLKSICASSRLASPKRAGLCRTWPTSGNQNVAINSDYVTRRSSTNSMQTNRHCDEHRRRVGVTDPTETPPISP